MLKEKFKHLKVKLAFSRVGRIVINPFTNVVQQEAEQVLIAVHAIARGLCATGDTRVIAPVAITKARPDRPIRIGLFGNIANNLYSVTRCLRLANYDAELVIQRGNIDAHPMARPFWEDLEIVGEEGNGALDHEARWSKPDWIRVVDYDPGLQANYQNRFSAAFEVATLYREALGKPLLYDTALLLAQNMGHWSYIKEMGRYDICICSFAATALSIFSPVPTAVYPVGGDLFIAPFEETLLGLQMRAGFRRAPLIMAAGAYWQDYFERLQVSRNTYRCAFLMDTERYAPGDATEIRDTWRREIGGNIFVLAICRQSWEWKGNDRLIRAFARLNHPDMRLVLTAWGDDVARSKELIRELGIESRVLWLPIGSKAVVIRRAQAADVVADQFTMSSFGTSVMEAMATATPVIVKFDPPPPGSDPPPTPPFLPAQSEDEIEDALRRMLDPAARAEIGAASRAWIIENRGWENQVERFMDGIRSIL